MKDLDIYCRLLSITNIRVSVAQKKPKFQAVFIDSNIGFVLRTYLWFALITKIFWNLFMVFMDLTKRTKFAKLKKSYHKKNPCAPSVLLGVF